MLKQSFLILFGNIVIFGGGGHGFLTETYVIIRTYMSKFLLILVWFAKQPTQDMHDKSEIFPPPPPQIKNNIMYF